MSTQVGNLDLNSCSKSQFFKNPIWPVADISKTVKCNIPVTVWPISVIFGVVMRIGFCNPAGYQNDAVAHGSHVENKNCNIFTTILEE